MADMTDVKIRLNFWRSAYEKLTAAYTALVDGRVKSYTIDDRQLTRFDLGTLEGRNRGGRAEDRRADRPAERQAAPQGLRRHPPRLVTFFVRSRK